MFTSCQYWWFCWWSKKRNKRKKYFFNKINQSLYNTKISKYYVVYEKNCVTVECPFFYWRVLVILYLSAKKYIVFFEKILRAKKGQFRCRQKSSLKSKNKFWIFKHNLIIIHQLSSSFFLQLLSNFILILWCSYQTVRC